MNNGKRCKETLRAGKALIGTWVTLADPASAEIMAEAGLDFIILDTEHAPYSPPLAQNMLMGLRGSQCAAIVRVPWNEPWMVKQVLDIGADGIMFPMIMNTEEARKAVASTRYPPQGIRGFAPRRVAGYGFRFDEYVAEANESIVVLAQIEHIQAVDRVEEIAAVEGVDALYVGPADLTASLGRLPEFGHAEVKAAIDRVAEVCLRLKKPFGVYTGSPADAIGWVKRGGQVQTIGEDFMYLVEQTTAGLAAVRSALKGL